MQILPSRDKMRSLLFREIPGQNFLPVRLNRRTAQEGAVKKNQRAAVELRRRDISARRD